MRKLIISGVSVIIIVVVFITIIMYRSKEKEDFPQPLHAISRSDIVSSISWSPNGELIAIGGYDHKINIWNISNWQIAFSFDNHSDRVFSIAWNPNGYQVASIGADNILNIWDPTNGELLTKISGQYSSTDELLWLSEKTLVIVGDELIVWDIENEETLDISSISENLWSIEQNFVAITNGSDEVKVIGFPANELLQKHSEIENITSIALAPHGEKLATGTEDGILTIWGNSDIDTIIFEVPTLNPIIDIAWSSDEKQLAIIVGYFGGPTKVYILDADLGRIRFELEPPVDTFMRWLTWNPKGNILVCSSWSNPGLAAGPLGNYAEHSYMQLWDSKDGNLMESIKHPFLITKPQWNRNGDLLAVSGTTQVYLWENQR